jgi:hypothetical protein
MGARTPHAPRLDAMSPSQRRLVIPVCLGLLILIAVIAAIVN